MRHAVASLVSVVLWLTSPVAAWAAGPASGQTWTGTWDTRWRDGGARLELHQDGAKVAGFYPAYGGRIEGDVDGRELTGRWIEGPRSGGLQFVLAPDGQTFMGRFANGEWWTGGRVAVAAQDAAADQSTPRQTVTAFVEAGNAAREGAPDALAAAARLLDFGPEAARLLPGEKIDAARQLFALVDQTTFHLWAIQAGAGAATGGGASGAQPDGAQGGQAPPAQSSQAQPSPAQVQPERADVTLTQAGTGATLTLTLTRQAGGRWFIVNPTPAAMDAARKGLLARSSGRLPAAEDVKLRRNPRDAFRSFLDGFADWSGSGRAQALGALDLSDLPEAVRDYQGELAAQYLKQVLDRVGFAVPQEVPDDPTSREPYVLFSHPVGTVVIAPTGTGDALSWKITPDSVRTARALFIATEDLPLVRGGVEAGLPDTAYFRLRGWVRERAPALLQPLGELEAWQAIAWALALVVSAVLAVGVAVLVLGLLRAGLGAGVAPTVRELRWPLWLAATFTIYKQVIPVVGLPEVSKEISVGTTGVLLAIALMWVGWRLADLIVEVWFRRAGRAATLDNIVVSLAFAAIKLGIVAGGLVFIARELSLPYEGVIAGLSIGGLAVAFASRETISNVFGAGVLAIDRPFRRGDWIITGDAQGSVESVGIRSTRIRTGEDSLVVVPNGKLSDATVNNLGTRRHHVTKSKVPVAYGASAGAIRAFADGIEGLIAALPEAVPGRTEVNVASFGPEAIQVEYVVCLDGRRISREPKVLSELALDIMQLGESLGLRLGKTA